MANNNGKNGKAPKKQTIYQQIEQMKIELQERELRARFAKANHDIMFYSIEGEKLQPEYKNFITRESERQAEAKKQYEDFMAGINKVAEGVKAGEEGPAPELKIEDGIELGNVELETENTEAPTASVENENLN